MARALAEVWTLSCLCSVLFKGVLWREGWLGRFLTCLCFILSYQLPKLPTQHMVFYPNAPPPPPLEDHNMPASECEWVCTEEEHLHLLSLQSSMEMAHKVEEGTRDQRSVHDWHMLWKPRITSSRFREVCHVQGDSSAESLAERIIRAQNKQCKWRRGPKWNLMQQRSILSVPMSITHPVDW